MSCACGGVDCQAHYVGIGLCNAGQGDTELVSWCSEDDIEEFMRSDAFLSSLDLTPEQRDEVCSAIRPRLERLKRSHDWAQLSAPVRARFLGLLVGDGSMSANASISLQAGLCMLCMSPALSIASQMHVCNASLMLTPMLFRGETLLGLPFTLSCWAIWAVGAPSACLSSTPLL